MNKNSSSSRTMIRPLLQTYMDYIIILLNCICAQLIKMMTRQCAHYQSKSFLEKLVASGGAPSAHTTVVVSLACINYINQGLHSPVTLMSFAFTLVVMYDAIGVRNHVTKLNKIIKTLVQDKSAQEGTDHAQSTLLQCLDDTVGHTPSEIMYGTVFGTIMTIMFKKTLPSLF